ncbi:MAG: NADH-quinone oxidoreductase subunit G [Alphaproteobacteria bacterium]|nr:NADH-quinone oxidoreductase subunit G [Alphaproteobacteria bacterium]
MPKLTIDGIEIEVEPGTTVLQAAEQLGIEIPRFCYHERLSIAGNCRMCLVEVAPGPPKPVASCAMPTADGMIVKTDSPMVRKARKGVMEFILINHPLDCPTCDQGGECDLQDQAMLYGCDRGRFHEEKRGVQDKDFGPLIKNFMTRCILCTRCVRFATEVCGVPDVGAIGRGEHTEITTYLDRALASELSGNLVDLCPVGALTNKPYAFSARSWELRRTESIDVLDAMGCNIRIDTRGSQVMRVLPRVNEDVNEEWISDKSRHACDGLLRQRLDTPYVRRDGQLRPASWAEAFAAIAGRVKGLPGGRIAAIAGDQADCESMVALKDLMTALGSDNLECRQDGARVDPSVRASYLFNSTLAGIEAADALLIIGANPRWEAPVLNARIRKRYLTGKLKTGVVGPRIHLTYRYDHLGEGPAALKEVAAGRHPFFEVMKHAQRPMLILGMGALTRADGGVVLGEACKLAYAAGLIKPDWNGFNVLHTAAARVGGLDLGFVPGRGRGLADLLADAGTGAIEVVYLLGADEMDMTRLGKAFVIYQGHHGDAGAQRADVVLPGAAYTEKDATYVNTEGRVQNTRMATFPPGEAREDWKIVRALSEVLGHRLPFDTLAQVRSRLVQVNPVFAGGEVTHAAWGAFGESGTLDPAPFLSPIQNFYMTDPISRASATMAECTRVFIMAREAQGTGTHG